MNGGMLQMMVLGVVGIGVVAGSLRRYGVAAHVITGWKAAPEPDTEGYFVRIAGRPEGFLNFLRSLVGLGETAELMVSGRDVVYRRGAYYSHIPHTSISSITHGRVRPWLTAIVVAMVVAAGLFALMTVKARGDGGGGLTNLVLPVLLGAAAGVIYFMLNKTLIVGVVESGGQLHALGFKASMIEGQRIDEAKIAEVVEILSQLVLNRRFR
jgi:hypothetical protein